MNQSNLYSYFILSGVWNDLAIDVLMLIKEYLQVHLNRRLLHDDYNVFLEKVDKQVEISKKGDGFYEDTLIYRHGLKSHLRSGFLSYKGFYIQKCIDNFAVPKYFILGQQIHINNYEFNGGTSIYGINDETRRHFITCFKNKYNESIELGLNFFNSSSLDSNDLKFYLKNLMKEEDNGFVVTMREDYILRWTR